jgi:phosphomannomutase
VPNLDAIVKAYDIRGTVPDQLDASAAYALGVAFARFTGASAIVVAHDMRPSGLELVDAFQRGALNHGVDVTNLGLASSDLLYYASGKFNVPGAMFTASHNPAQYNGIKCCLAGARSIGIDNGLRDMKAIAVEVLDGREPPAAAKAGTLSFANLLAEFAEHVVGFIAGDTLRPLRIVADTANWMAHFLTILPIRCSRPISETCKRECSLVDSTWVWHLMATRTAFFLSMKKVAACLAARQRHCWRRDSSALHLVQRFSTT